MLITITPFRSVGKAAQQMSACGNVNISTSLTMDKTEYDFNVPYDLQVSLTIY
jgi:hypothetical protein